MKTHEFQCRVYYEDTDMAGIVYYANYLRYIERARSEQIRELGVDQKELKDTRGIVLVVRKIAADYLGSARLDDVLIVKTILTEVSGVRINYQQDVFCGDKKLFAANLEVVSMTTSGRPTRLPADIRRKYSEITA